MIWLNLCKIGLCIYLVGTQSTFKAKPRFLRALGEYLLFCSHTRAFFASMTEMTLCDPRAVRFLGMHLKRYPKGPGVNYNQSDSLRIKYCKLS